MWSSLTSVEENSWREASVKLICTLLFLSSSFLRRWLVTSSKSEKFKGSNYVWKGKPATNHLSEGGSVGTLNNFYHFWLASKAIEENRPLEDPVAESLDGKTSLGPKHGRTDRPLCTSRPGLLGHFNGAKHNNFHARWFQLSNKMSSMRKGAQCALHIQSPLEEECGHGVCFQIHSHTLRFQIHSHSLWFQINSHTLPFQIHSHTLWAFFSNENAHFQLEIEINCARSWQTGNCSLLCQN